MTTPPTLYALSSRGVVEITGPERVAFLNNLITNDVAPGGASYAALLTPQGKILFDFFVVDTGEALLLDCHGEYAADLIKRLNMYRLRSKVEIEDISDKWEVLATDEDVTPDGDVVSFADPRLQGLPRRILAPHGTTPTIPHATEAEYLGKLLERGIPNVPLDAGQNEMFLLEANFDELNGVDFKKGCYIGQELAARMKHRATVRKRLIPVESKGDMPPAGTAVIANEREVGTLKSGIRNRATALLRIDRVEGANTITADDVPLKIQWPEWLPK